MRYQARYSHIPSSSYWEVDVVWNQGELSEWHPRRIIQTFRCIILHMKQVVLDNAITQICRGQVCNNGSEATNESCVSQEQVRGI